MCPDHIYALCVKEMVQIKKDRSVFIIVFILPVLLICIYGYGILMDVKPVKIALYDADLSKASIEIKKSFAGSDYFDLTEVLSLHEGRELFYKNKVIALIYIKDGFYRSMSENRATILVNINGVESFNAFISMNYIKNTLNGIKMKYLENAKRTEHDVFDINYRHYFNHNERSSDFLMPGQMVGIVTLIACFMCSIVIAKEFDSDSFNGLKATSMSAFEFVVGKFIPYFVLSLIGAALTFFITVVMFSLPYRGSVLMGLSIVFMYVFTSVSIGLFISILTKNQFLACVLSVIVSFLPSILLSGVIFDLRAIAPAIASFAYTLPPTYAVDAMRSCFLSDSSDSLVFDLFYISMCGFVFFALTVYMVRRNLK